MHNNKQGTGPFGRGWWGQKDQIGLKRLGRGISGAVYDLGDGRVKKIFHSTDCRLYHPGYQIDVGFRVIDLWAQVKDGLKVIPYIDDWDGKSYTMEMLETPCDEATWMTLILKNHLKSPKEEDWDEESIKRAIGEFGDEKVEFTKSWLKDFCEDYHKITGTWDIKEDIRPVNIGKDKNGNIKCFDWFNPFRVVLDKNN